MIVVKLMGGLGNQMFQYAFGKRVAMDRQTKLKLDVFALNDKSVKEGYTIRDFQLNSFNITAAIASNDECKRYRKDKMGKILNMILFYLPLKIQNLYIRELHFHFFKKALDAPHNSYLDGYWQSEKYFLPVREQLIKDFEPSSTLSDETIQFAERIKNSSAVSIHVRRGDYLSVQVNAERFGACTEAYYQSAMEHISNKVANPVFYVFSNEPEWFKKNVKTAFPVEYVSHNIKERSYEDLYLMTLCKHNIIANSSFSWWGAWLNNNNSKIVIAPVNWFRDKSINTKDLLPETWIKL